jgi:chemotaxis protein MotB
MTRPTISPAPRSLRASGDRWLFGYADIVTLLFACFASLYAAQAAPVASQALAAADPGPAARLAPAALERELAAFVGAQAGLPGLEVEASARGLVISLPEAGSFPPGSAELGSAARRVMLELADRLRTLPNLIRVEGHTDNVPIHTPEFASNWELSSARATRVVQLLIEEGALAPTRLSAAGYAEHRPKQPNDRPEARARNRRVDIVVLAPATADREEPGRPRQ